MSSNSDAAFWRFSLDPNRDPKAERSGKHRRGADGIIRPSPAVFCGLHGLADDAADGVGGGALHPLRGVGVGAEGKACGVAALPTAIFALADAALAIGSFLRHGLCLW